MKSESDEVAKMRREVFGDTMKLLDQTIFEWETKMNKAHSKSPFEGMYEGSVVQQDNQTK